MLKIVLCVCTCKRPAGLSRLLEAVAELDFTEGHLSIVVVDNDAVGGEGRAISERVAPTYRWPLISTIEERRGIPFARNRAITLALQQDPDFIAMLDDDEWPSREWLRELLRVQAETGADVVGGPAFPEFATATPSWLIEGCFFESAHHPDGAQVGTQIRLFVTTYNFLARSSCFRALLPEPFDTDLGLTGGDDLVFFRRLAARNYRMHWAAAARVFEAIPSSRANLLWLMRRRFNRGNIRVLVDRSFEPGIGRELQRLQRTAGLFFAGMFWMVVNWRDRASCVRGGLTICRALGMMAAHLGVRYLPYRRIHGT